MNEQLKPKMRDVYVRGIDLEALGIWIAYTVTDDPARLAECKRNAEIISAALSHSDVEQAPKGWKLVPVEPTEEMRKAFVNVMWPCEKADLAWAAMLAAAPQAPVAAPFQQRVQPWMLECFGAEIAADREERNHRFFEEATELVQACGMTASKAHQLVDYTFGRPIGEPSQEVGGVMVTLAALCLANSLDMHAAGETELARISVPETVEKIRAKQAAKPKHSPLPQAPAAADVKPQLTLNGQQLLTALDYIAPDRATDRDQLECEVTIAYGDGHDGTGYYCWTTDYPDEGSMLLSEEIDETQEPVADGARGEPHLTEDQWLALAERHVGRDWDARQPDGFLNAVKLLCEDFAAISMRPTDDALWDQTLRERDNYCGWADKLADAIATHLGVNIGEHSNVNNPWCEALEAIENAAGEPDGASEAGEAVAWRHSKTHCLYETEEDVPLADGDEWAEPLCLCAAQQAVTLTDDARDEGGRK